MLVGGQPTSIPLPFNQCVVPQGINGPVAIFITSDGQPLVNNVVDRATSQLVAGPTMAFIDTQPQMLGMLVRTSSSSSSSSSNSTVSSGSSSDSGSSSSSSSAGSTVTSSAVTSITTQTISPEQAQSIIQSASASATAASSSSTSSSSSPPNNSATGPADNGAVTINGWRTVPASSIQG